MSEIEFSPAIARALDEYAPASFDGGDWDELLRRTRRSRRRPVFVLVAAAAVLAALAFGTPLGSAIRDTVAGFSAWLKGTPGTPATPGEQQAFEEATSHSWVAFPGSPQLRRLIQAHVDGVDYELFGFRSGDSLCIRVVVFGAAQGSTIECAPVADLENDDAPVRVLLADWGVGQGDKTKTVGFDTYWASLATVTAGIAADGVRSVQLTDDQGTHAVETSSNSFLYISPRPDVDQLVTHVRAELASGETASIPFQKALRAPSPSIGTPGAEPGGPTQVERVLDRGTIGWLDRRDERGEPLSSLSHHLAGFGKPEWGRVLTPDPASSIRVAVWITADHGVCSAVIERVGASGGCIGTLGHLFEPIARPGAPPRPPFTGGYSTGGGGTQYGTFAGLASDDVARLEIFPSTGPPIPVALRDNAYLAEVALSRLPAKLVAYDASGRVIGIEATAADQSPATPVGDPIVDLSTTAAGTSVELRAVETKEGGQCWFVRARGEHELNSGSCVGRDWTEAPLRVGSEFRPAVYISGRAREDIRTITLRYADGDEQEIEPGADGYVLSAIPAAHREPSHELVELVGHAADGRVVARISER